ncbi:DNA polymerase I [Diplonema papillatum]|nr:DNA polymerase I [Diplonema papillatum]
MLRTKRKASSFGAVFRSKQGRLDDGPLSEGEPAPAMPGGGGVSRPAPPAAPPSPLSALLHFHKQKVQEAEAQRLEARACATSARNKEVQRQNGWTATGGKGKGGTGGKGGKASVASSAHPPTAVKRGSSSASSLSSGGAAPVASAPPATAVRRPWASSSHPGPRPAAFAITPRPAPPSAVQPSERGLEPACKRAKTAGENNHPLANSAAPVATAAPGLFVRAATAAGGRQEQQGPHPASGPSGSSGGGGAAADASRRQLLGMAGSAGGSCAANPQPTAHPGLLPAEGSGRPPMGAAGCLPSDAAAGHSAANPQPGLFPSGAAAANQQPGLFPSSAAAANQQPGLFPSGAAAANQQPGLFPRSAAAANPQPGLLPSGAAAANQQPGLFPSSAAAANQQPGLFPSSATAGTPRRQPSGVSPGSADPPGRGKAKPRAKKASAKSGPAGGGGPAAEAAAVPGIELVPLDELLGEVARRAAAGAKPPVLAVVLHRADAPSEVGGDVPFDGDLRRASVCLAVHKNPAADDASFAQEQGCGPCDAFVSSDQLGEESYRKLSAVCEDGRVQKVVYGAQPLLGLLAFRGAGSGGRAIEPARVHDLRCMVWMLSSSCPGSIDEAMGELYPDLSAIGASKASPVLAWARSMLAAYLKAKTLLESLRLGYCFANLEMPVAWILANMRVNGFPLDVRVLTASSEQQQLDLADIERKAKVHATNPAFNIQSPDDVREELFDRLQLDKVVPPGVLRVTGKKGVFSTDKDTLQALAAHHPLPDLVMQHRALQKLLTTYVQNLAAHARPLRTAGPPASPHHRDLHVVQPLFHQEGTDTGRLSCSAPNLQNQPRKDERGEQGRVRYAFVPYPGEVLIALDYSQIEVRVLAHMSRDPTLCAALAAGGDLHRSIAAKIFQKPPDQVTPSERRVGKRVVFGTFYGQGVKALAASLSISVDRASCLAQSFKRAFPSTVAWAEETVRSCRRTGEVRTFANRLRKLPHINSSQPFERAQAERQAVNTVIQGSAADIIKMAMVTSFAVARRQGLRMLCQVHDELIFSAPPAAVAAAVPLLKHAMETATSLVVPLCVEVETGPSWGELAAWQGT